MQLTKIFKIFFGLPDAVYYGITVASHYFIHINSVRLKYAAVLIVSFVLTQKTIAQHVDSNFVDTVSMSNIHSTNVAADSAVASSDDTSAYDDEDDGYVDTTSKHIYDTSEYFFTWKTYSEEPYAKEKFAQRHLIDKDVNELKQQDDFWYIPAIEKLETRLKNDPAFRDSLLKEKNRELTDENSQSFMQQSWFNTLIWIIIIGFFLAAVSYFLFQNKISLFTKESASSGEAAGGEQAEDIFHLSYTKLVQQAEKENDYRVAIRLMYLQTLKILSETNKIHYQPDYTDMDYLQQLHQTKFYKEFFSVMRSYEYVWYGKFEISAERYKTVKNDFLALQNKIA